MLRKTCLDYEYELIQVEILCQVFDLQDLFFDRFYAENTVCRINQYVKLNKNCELMFLPFLNPPDRRLVFCQGRKPSFELVASLGPGRLQLTSTCYHLRCYRFNVLITKIINYGHQCFFFMYGFPIGTLQKINSMIKH